MRIRSCLLLLSVLVTVSFAADASAMQATRDLKATRDIKVISSAGARALADACTAWAEQNKQIVAMAILDWGGNLIESHAMEGAPMNAIDTALLKAKSALRWRRPTSETNKMVRSGENLAPTFHERLPATGRASRRGQWPGRRRDGRFQCRRREMCPGGDRRGVQGTSDLFGAVNPFGRQRLWTRRDELLFSPGKRAYSRCVFTTDQEGFARSPRCHRR